MVQSRQIVESVVYETIRTLYSDKQEEPIDTSEVQAQLDLPINLTSEAIQSLKRNGNLFEPEGGKVVPIDSDLAIDFSEEN